MLSESSSLTFWKDSCTSACLTEIIVYEKHCFSSTSFPMQIITSFWHYEQGPQIMSGMTYHLSWLHCNGAPECGEGTQESSHMDKPFELEGCNWGRIPVPVTPIPQGFWENPWRKIDERLLVTFWALCSFCAVHLMGIGRASSFQTDSYSQVGWCHSPAQGAQACLFTWPM